MNLFQYLAILICLSNFVLDQPMFPGPVSTNI